MPASSETFISSPCLSSCTHRPFCTSSRPHGHSPLSFSSPRHTKPWRYWKTIGTKAGYIAVSRNRWFSQNQKKKLDIRYPCCWNVLIFTGSACHPLCFDLLCSFCFLISLFPLPVSFTLSWQMAFGNRPPGRRRGDAELSQPQLFFWNLPILVYIREEKLPEEDWELGWGEARITSHLGNDPKPAAIY